MIDNCSSYSSSQTGRDEGVTGEKTERESGRKEKARGGGREEMIGDICYLSSKIELDREEGEVGQRGRDSEI